VLLVVLVHGLLFNRMAALNGLVCKGKGENALESETTVRVVCVLFACSVCIRINESSTEKPRQAVICSSLLTITSVIARRVHNGRNTNHHVPERSGAVCFCCLDIARVI
jgi:hypothetical protein